MAAKNGNGGQEIPIASREKLTKAMQEEAEKRVEECSRRINLVLEEMNCSIVGLPRILQDGRVVADVGIVSK